MNSKFLFISFLLLILYSCKKEDGWDCTKSLGSVVTEKRDLEIFDYVLLEDRINLEYHYDSIYRAEVEFGKNMLSSVETVVSEGKLSIRNQAKCDWVRDLSQIPTVRIYAPTLREFENRCAADITFKDALLSSDFTYQQWESNGHVLLLLNTASAKIYAHAGYVNLRVCGRSIYTELYNACNGKLDARQLVSNDVHVNNSSFQEIFCSSNGYLYAAIYGNGDILYRGVPITLETTIVGNGEVKPF